MTTVLLGQIDEVARRIVAAMSLYNNVQRMKLNVDQVLPIHGRQFPWAEFAKMAAASDPVITSDSTDHRDGQLRWSAVAKAFTKLYEDHMGQGDATPQAAVALADWDTSNSWGGRHLFHSRR